MDKVKFWKLIDASRRAAEGDPEEQMDLLREKLIELPAEEIVAFDRIFSEYHSRAYTWGLWGAAFVIGEGCSDDGFMDFRGWLISRGEKVYETALANPDSLAKVLTDDDGDCQVEGFQYVPSQAWEEKTGKDAEDFPDHGLVVPKEPSGEEWKEEDLGTLYPKLSRMFGE